MEKEDLYSAAAVLAGSAALFFGIRMMYGALKELAEIR